MSMRKVYVQPHSEVVFVCKDICEGEHLYRQSYLDTGHDDEDPIIIGPSNPSDDEGGAKGWMLWDDSDFSFE